MAVIRPFECVRPAEKVADRVAALPYDVYDSKEARAEVEREPLSFLKIDRAETQFDESVDMYSEQVYKKAHDMLMEAIDDGTFITDKDKAYYVYELTMDGRTQTGIVACASIDDYLNNVIKKHENTRADKELDRINHVDTCSAQTGPIFLAYRANAVISAEVAKAKQEKPVYSFTAVDGIRHQVWKISSKESVEAIENAFAGINQIYIADGHHRAASAVKVGLRRREANPGYTGNEEFMAKIKDKFTVSESSTQVAPSKKGEFGMYLGRKWYTLTAKEEILSSDPVDGLDVAVLQNNVLEPLLGIHDPKTDKRIDFVGGIRGLGELERRCSEDCVLAFSMYATSIGELFAVADAGLLMPPKSTWFEPKLRSGLFIHRF